VRIHQQPQAEPYSPSAELVSAVAASTDVADAGQLVVDAVPIRDGAAVPAMVVEGVAHGADALGAAAVSMKQVQQDLLGHIRVMLRALRA